MAETREKERDVEIEDEGEEEEEENGILSHSQMPNTSLAELNMMLVIISLFYFSNDDENRQYGENENVTKDRVDVTKRLQTNKREKHEPKLFGKKSFPSRFQTTIKDSRHRRKMWNENQDLFSMKGQIYEEGWDYREMVSKTN